MSQRAATAWASIRIARDLYERLAALATAEDRSVSNCGARLLEEALAVRESSMPTVHLVTELRRIHHIDPDEAT